eukprot:450723-Prymnesium_polylepis.1
MARAWAEAEGGERARGRVGSSTTMEQAAREPCFLASVSELCSPYWGCVAWRRQTRVEANGLCDCFVYVRVKRARMVVAIGVDCLQPQQRIGGAERLMAGTVPETRRAR